MKKIFYGGGWAAGLVAMLLTFIAKAENTNLSLYGISFSTDQLFAVNPTTGQGTLVGKFNATISGYGIAAHYGRLYTFDPNVDKIVEINPQNGAIGRYIDIGVTNLQGEGDLTFRADGVGFLASALHADGSVANDLYTFDVIGGTSHRVGTTTLMIDGLAFDTNNVLYALAQDDTNLYTVNTNTGVMTVVGPLGIALSSPYAALTFGPDGTLYAAINDQLYTINKTNGAASAWVSDGTDFGFSSVSGLAFQSPQQAQQLVGVTFFGNQLFSIDTGSGQGTLIGNLGSTVNSFGLGSTINALYGFNPSNDKVVFINPTTGQAGAQISIGLTNVQGEGDLAFDNNGVGYVAATLDTNGNPQNSLFVFNLGTGAHTLLGSSIAIDAMAFDTNGVLYALGQDDTNFYTINTNNGVATVVGPLGVALSSPFAGMTIGPDGTVYAAINDQLYTINKSTGAASVVSTNVLDFGFSSVSGISFAPTPSTIHLSREGTNTVLYYTYSGNYNTIQAATNAAGPYTNYQQQANPIRLGNSSGQMFFRLSR